MSRTHLHKSEINHGKKKVFAHFPSKWLPTFPKLNIDSTITRKDQFTCNERNGMTSNVPLQNLASAIGLVFCDFSLLK